MMVLTDKGLYCPAGDFYIDPRGAVETALITHAHSDHARRGSQRYYCPASGVSLLKARLGGKISVTSFPFRVPFALNGVQVSFHSAGHILGSAQVRIERAGEVWVASGDYKREDDPTCEPFEPVKCDVFITEATFGTPSYVWEKRANLAEQILAWWKENAARGVNSVLFAYSLGKAQRVLGVLQPYADRPIYCDPNVSAMNECYLEQGIRLARTTCLSAVDGSRALEGELILAPQTFLKSPVAKILGRFETAFASGWMSGGGLSYGRGYDRGFVMSDHADWDDLVRTVLETGAKRVYVQHRGKGALVKHLRSLGLHAFPESALAVEVGTQLTLL